MKRILLATSNKFKLAQMQYVSDYYKTGVRVVPARDIFGALSKFDKLGNTPEEVALKLERRDWVYRTTRSYRSY